MDTAAEVEEAASEEQKAAPVEKAASEEAASEQDAAASEDQGELCKVLREALSLAVQANGNNMVPVQQTQKLLPLMDMRRTSRQLMDLTCSADLESQKKIGL